MAVLMAGKAGYHEKLVGAGRLKLLSCDPREPPDLGYRCDRPRS
jgi:hypothetical protein